MDTYSYGAHGTAADALWAGVPTLTRAGPRLADRVGASLAADLGVAAVLVARTRADFRAVATALLARRPALAALRRRVEAARGGAALFHGGRWMAAWEAAAATLLELLRAGRAPALAGRGLGPAWRAGEYHVVVAGRGAHS